MIKKINFMILFLIVSVVLNGALTIYLFSQNDTQELEAVISYETVGTAAEALLAKEKSLLTEAMEVAENPQKAIAMMVLNREVVKDAYFVYLDDLILIEKIKDYNMQTNCFKREGEMNVIQTLEKCFNFDYKIQVSTYYEVPSEIDIIVRKVSQYALYNNAKQLIQNDTELAQMLLMEPFQSNENWMDFIENETCIDDPRSYSKDDSDYFETIDTIVSALQLGTKGITEKVLAREIIEDTYFNGIEDKILLERIQEYNQLTAEYHLYFMRSAIVNAEAFFCLYEIDEDGEIQSANFNYFKRPIEQEVYAQRLSKQALYRNADKLIYNDPYMSPSLALEWGGSAGAWPRFIHSRLEPEEIEYYFKLADDIVKELS